MKKNTYVKQEFILNSTVPTRPNLTPKQTQTKPRYSCKVYLGFALGLLFGKFVSTVGLLWVNSEFDLLGFIVFFFPTSDQGLLSV